MNKSEALRKFIIPFVLFSIGILLRLPSLFKELPPYQFCDEDIFSSQVRDMLSSGSWIVNEFRAGGFNIYPILIITKIISMFTTQPLEYREIIIIGRFFYSVLLSSGAVVFIYLTSKLIFGNEKIGIYASICYLFSPYVIANSRIWYPDNYIAFFSAGLLYILVTFIKSHKNSKLKLALIALFYAMAVSSKYTALFLLLPIVISFARPNQDVRDVVPQIKNAIFLSVLIILFVSSINFSAFINHEKFLSDWIFNINNYNRSKDINWAGIGYYYFTMYVLTFGMLGCGLYIYGYTLIFKKNPIVFLLLISTATFLATYLGSAQIIIHRNMMLAVPYLMPVLGGALYFLLHERKINQNARIPILIGALFAIFSQVGQTLFTVNDDFKLESSLIANKWIGENIPPQSKVGSAWSCSGDSPAQVNNNAIVEDPYMDQHLEYYVFNSYWAPLVHAKYNEQAFWQFVKQKYIHFHKFNEVDIFKFQSSPSPIESFIPSGYALEAEISSNGPEIIILKKKQDF